MTTDALKSFGDVKLKENPDCGCRFACFAGKWFGKKKFQRKRFGGKLSSDLQWFPSYAFLIFTILPALHTILSVTAIIGGLYAKAEQMYVDDGRRGRSRLRRRDISYVFSSAEGTCSDWVGGDSFSRSDIPFLQMILLCKAQVFKRLDFRWICFWRELFAFMKIIVIRPPEILANFLRKRYKIKKEKKK